MGAAVLPAAIIATSVIGTGITAMAQSQAGQAAVDQSNYQAAVARNNSILAQRAADDARARGGTEVSQQAIKTRQTIAALRAGAAARGVEVDSGSARGLVEDTAAIGKLDELTIRSNAEREAAGFERQGAQFNQQQHLESIRQKNLKMETSRNVAATALTGTGSVASKWYAFRRQGAL